jgi:hypothetical protein
MRSWRDFHAGFVFTIDDVTRDTGRSETLCGFDHSSGLNWSALDRSDSGIERRFALDAAHRCFDIAIL